MAYNTATQAQLSSDFALLRVRPEYSGARSAADERADSARPDVTHGARDMAAAHGAARASDGRISAHIAEEDGEEYGQHGSQHSSTRVPSYSGEYSVSVDATQAQLSSDSKQPSATQAQLSSETALLTPTRVALREGEPTPYSEALGGSLERARPSEAPLPFWSSPLG